MFKTRRQFFSFGAGAVALGGLTAAAPRAAHAIAATLVQVTNTAANPVITQSVNTQASQLVELVTPFGADIFPSSIPVKLQLISASGSSPYTIPAGQHLVITQMDITLLNGKAALGLYAGDLQAAYASVTAIGTQQFHYPTGIPVASGQQVSVVYYTGVTGDVSLNVYGYLTAN